MSFALRAAMGAALVVLALTVAGAVWGLLRAEQALRQQLDLVLAGEAEAFLREYQELGLPALAAAVETTARRRGPLRAALLAPDGRRVAGLLPAAPARLQGFATLAPDEAGVRRRALGAVLGGGFNLILAADTGPADAAAAALAWTPPAAGLAAALAALLLGFLAARSLESRLQAASASARAIMDGDLARRLPVTGRGDEFDRLAVTVNALLARIEALMRAQRQVTDDIAHDLRSPLSRLRQSLEGALARPRGAEADAATLEAALAELDQVLASFSALLRIARAESGALRAGFEPVDLSALARAAAELYAPLAEEQGRTLVADIAPGVTLPGDAALLRQAVANLIENALTHGAGRIGLTLTPDRALAVSDEGPGIPPEAREAVTRRFHRLDRSRSTPGTGLGLALVAAAGQAHGGRLELSGERGLVATLRL